MWPILQTINFILIPEHNRVVYVSFCSLIWTSFLAHMKALEAKKMQMDKKINNDVQITENTHTLKPVSETQSESKKVSNI